MRIIRRKIHPSHVMLPSTKASHSHYCKFCAHTNISPKISLLCNYNKIFKDGTPVEIYEDLEGVGNGKNNG